MENREFLIRSTDLEARTVTGIAVPWNQVVEVGGYRESFERGAITGFDETLLRFEHRDTIGKVIKGEETDEGYMVTAQISDTTQGRDAHTLLKDGVIKKFSVGFQPVEHRDEDGVVVRTKVNFKEVSLVSFPAYAGASVSEVRSAEEIKSNNSKENNIMSNDITNEVADVREAVTDLERRFATFGTAPVAAEAISMKFRSYGEYVKAYAEGDTDARDFATRAYTGAVLANVNTENSWVKDVILLVNNYRKVANAFSKGALPAKGMNVEYNVLGTNTVAVGVQATEGADLPFGQVTLGTGSAPVNTYGGYSEASFQLITRSEAPYLDTLFKAMAIQYGKVTNDAVRAAIVAATTNTVTQAAATSVGFIGGIVDAAGKIQADTGLNLDFGIVSTDVFKTLATMVDSSNRPLLVLNGDGQNTIGNANVNGPQTFAGLSGSLAGVQVIVDPSAAAKTLWYASSEAVTSWESAGAPLRLEDDNIRNLTHAYSVFGYMAVGVTAPKGIVKVTLP